MTRERVAGEAMINAAALAYSVSRSMPESAMTFNAGLGAGLIDSLSFHDYAYGLTSLSVTCNSDRDSCVSCVSAMLSEINHSVAFSRLSASDREGTGDQGVPALPGTEGEADDAS